MNEQAGVQLVFYINQFKFKNEPSLYVSSGCAT